MMTKRRNSGACGPDRAIAFVLCAMGAGFCAANHLPVSSVHAASSGGAPVAISISADDKGVVLQSDGALVELDVTAGKRGRVLFQSGNYYTAIDTSAVVASSGTRACISLQFQNETTFYSWFVVVIDQKRQVWTPLKGQALGGCALDRSGKQGFIVSAVSGEIFVIDLDLPALKGKSRYLATIPHSHLGSTSLDRRLRRPRGVPRRRRRDSPGRGRRARPPRL